MCPAIDLEMTGLLTHTICSANEERQRGRETVNEMFSQSRSIRKQLIKKEAMQERLMVYACVWREREGKSDVVLKEMLQVDQQGHFWTVSEKLGKVKLEKGKLQCLALGQQDLT